MHRSSLFRAVPVLVLVLSLAVPPLQAAEPRRDLVPDQASWSFLAQVWDFLTSAWAENGIGLDPNGGGLPLQSPKVDSDNGCGFDPNGHCLPDQTADSDSGLGFDPDGGWDR